MGRKGKQLIISGHEPETIEDIEKAADAYVEARDARMKLTKTEVDAKTVLLETMKQHKLTEYKYEGKTVILETDESVKVKKLKGDGDVAVEEDEDSEEPE